VKETLSKPKKAGRFNLRSGQDLWDRGISDGQTLSPFGPSSFKDFPAIGRLHPLHETVGSFSFYFTGLIGNRHVLPL